MTLNEQNSLAQSSSHMAKLRVKDRRRRKKKKRRDIRKESGKQEVLHKREWVIAFNWQTQRTWEDWSCELLICLILQLCEKTWNLILFLKSPHLRLRCQTVLNVLERELADLQGADLDACLPPPHRDKTFPLYNLEPKKGIKDIGKKKNQTCDTFNSWGRERFVVSETLPYATGVSLRTVWRGHFM